MIAAHCSADGEHEPGPPLSPPSRGGPTCPAGLRAGGVFSHKMYPSVFDGHKRWCCSAASVFRNGPTKKAGQNTGDRDLLTRKRRSLPKRAWLTFFCQGTDMDQTNHPPIDPTAAREFKRVKAELAKREALGVDVKTAKRMLGVARSTVYLLLNSGQLQSYTVLPIAPHPCCQHQRLRRAPGQPSPEAAAAAPRVAETPSNNRARVTQQKRAFRRSDGAPGLPRPVRARPRRLDELGIT
jgi:hypothetical protein